MVVLVLLIGILNLCVGYAIAVSLGYGPPTLMGAWEGLTVEPRFFAATPSRSANLEQSSENEEEEEVTEEAAEEDSVEPEEEQHEETSEDDSDGEELERPDEQFVEGSVLNFKVAMIKSGMALSGIDTKLRAAPFEAELIQECLKELQDDCSAYMVEQEEAADRFRERVDELGDLAALGEEIEMTILEETAQIETTLSNLAHMDFDSDLDIAGRRLLEEIHNLLSARHKLQDGQDAAFVAIARHEGRLGSVEERLQNDPLTRMPNRIGLETTMETWWKDGLHRTHELCAMLVDLDGFADINENHGVMCGDKILFHVARTIETESDEESLAGRFAGQRFLVLLKDLGPRAAAKKAETIRLTLEQTVFSKADERIRVTMTDAVTAVTPEDTPESLLKRLSETIDKARQSGPNRSYLHDGRNAEQVEFPSLAVEERAIKLS